MIEFYIHESINMLCTRILDLVAELRVHYIESPGTVSDALAKEIEDATIDMANAVLKLRRAESKLKEYRI